MNAPNHESTRRAFLQVAAASTVTAGLTPAAFARRIAGTTPPPTLRWGVVGTGSIANSMAKAIQGAQGAELAAVSSRRMASAEAYAKRHGAAHAFDSWAEMST